jgi:hypothetical protein
MFLDCLFLVGSFFVLLALVPQGNAHATPRKRGAVLHQEKMRVLAGFCLTATTSMQIRDDW